MAKDEKKVDVDVAESNFRPSLGWAKQFSPQREEREVEKASSKQ